MAKPWAEFRAWAESRYCPPFYSKTTRMKLRRILADLAGRCETTEDLHEESIRAWILDHKDLRPETLRGHLRALAAACASAPPAKGFWAASPFTGLKIRRLTNWQVEELAPPVHTLAEIRRVLALADARAALGGWRAGRLRAVVYLLAFTGMRAREALGLRGDDVDLTGRWIHIRPNARRSLKTSASKARLPVPRPLAEVLDDWLPRSGCEWLIPGIRRIGPWIDGYPGTRAIDHMKELGKDAGVPRLTLLSFRHTLASLSEDWGIGELMLQRMLRHTSIRTQRGYRHPLDVSLQAAAAKIAY